jgi:molybdopterin-dependent oxidoreductase alpha subunit
MGISVRRRIGPYREILRAFWDNRDRPRYAWRILSRGVCDGCALGTTGLKDWTLDGVHLCWVRLNLLRLNTMPAMDPARLRDAEAAARLPEAVLRRWGRLPHPLIRRKGDPGFSPLSWDAALELAAARMAATDPRRMAFYLVSRGTVNETYYAAQKAARALGTNHIDNSARVCHSPSTTGLKETLGFGATTCSYSDLMRSDLVVLLGSNAANNQPVMMKYLHLAKKRGARVAVVNPFREPGLDRYWIPSNLDSALLGTRIADRFFSIRVGGDIAFLNGVLKILIERGAVDAAFVAGHTTGWADLEAALAGQSFAELEEGAGASREEMAAFADLYAGARSAIFIWSMGITMHRHGVENVKAIVNLALARGMVGRSGAGLMPIRGHSGVQGGSEMGCAPNLFPGGAAVDEAGARRLSEEWGFPVPAWKGDFIPTSLDRAHAGELDVLYCVGSNLFGILPDSDYGREAVARIPFRIHHDIVANPQMLVEPADTVLLLPATTRYEMAGGNTETSTERRIIFNPEIPGPRVEGARDEWRVLLDLAQRVKPEAADRLRFESTAAIREEIARVVPLYEGIQHLKAQGDHIQYGGPHLGEGGRFGLPGGKGRFTPLVPPGRNVPPGHFQLITRRGKQFNSMVLGARDMTLGAGRDTALLAPEDMNRLGLGDGDPAVLRSGTKEHPVRVRGGDVRPGTVVMTWPEANRLIPRGVSDPACGIPAYRDATVEIVTGTPTGTPTGTRTGTRT